MTSFRILISSREGVTDRRQKARQVITGLQQRHAGSSTWCRCSGWLRRRHLLWPWLWLFACVAVAAAESRSRLVFLVGTVGQTKVQMQLSTNAHSVGKYRYLKSSGGWLQLDGANSTGRIQLVESPENKPAQTTGLWDGRFTNRVFAGT